jgi:hypothetical protein
MEEAVTPAGLGGAKYAGRPQVHADAGVVAEGVPMHGISTDVLKYLQSLKAMLPNAVECKSMLSRTTCAVCGSEFQCRGALFSHIRKHGHAALTVRPANAISFTGEGGGCCPLERAAVDFLRSLLASVPPCRPEGVQPAHAALLEVELPPGFAEYSKTIDAGILTAMLDSGESMLTVMVARLLTCPPHGEAREVLLDLIKRAAASDRAAVWKNAQDFEVFSFPGLSSTIGVDSANGSSQPWRRPRAMWGLPPAISDLGPLGLARRDVGIGDAGEVGTCTELLKVLLPAEFRFDEECVVCAAKTFMCCGPEGSLARVEGCGCVMCPSSMQTWIEVQVDTEQKGTGEVCCAGCSNILSQGQVDSFCPTLAPVAERLGLEKALISMPDWRWCDAGCGSGGFLTGIGFGSGCKTMHCPTCDVGACVDCGVLSAHHSTASGTWRSCEEAVRERDGTRATEAWLCEKAKRCPKDHGGCGALTQRDGGCSHITCRVCRFQWCWLCNGKYKGKYTTGTQCPCG